MTLELITFSLGYPLAFLQRCDLLKVLAGSPLDQNKIHCSKRVVGANSSESGITVQCQDGSEFMGDVLVGADGIHSAVRGIMQAHIERFAPGATEKDMNTGIQHRSYAKDFSTVSFVTEGGKLFWFLFSKLDKKYYGKDIPRYKPEDAEQASEAFFNINMTDTIKYEEGSGSNVQCFICHVSNVLKDFHGIYATPNLGDLTTGEQCNLMVGAERVDFLPMPEKSLTATMPWSQKVGVGKQENKCLRAFYALPVLLLAHFAATNNDTMLDLKVSGYGWLYKILSTLVSGFIPVLSGFEAVERVQTIGLLGDLIPIQAIFMIEAARRGNFITIAHLLPLFFAILYQTPLENYHAADNRMTQIGKVKIIIPTILLSYILPSIAMFTVPGLSTRLWINGVFRQPFPIYARVIQLILGRFVRDTTEIDRIQNPEADMRYLRRIYAFAAVVAAIKGLYTRFNLPGYLPSATSCAGLYWILIHFMDLKVAGKLNAR
ncbi:hypothetical protein HYALB_00003376 [Hymenoscyphus albidus]|uniref:FAD-binding domain-containing protein n=1 Tax=Hymenoscyphus albidus TaxID=595503 RepID=A0A9N9LQ48_9HELO|nr:hypothetical protein HYALB_00003376 [Hymenoscyphus albidus]